MPLENRPAGDAMRLASSNRLRRYPNPDRDGERLYPLASPTAFPTFRIGADDNIFAIGSCFARNVEKALEAAGKRVLSREFDLGEIGDSLGESANFFNKYSIHSVLNELRWALDRSSFPGKDILYPLGKGQFVDVQLGVAKLAFPLERVLAFRHAYLDAIAQVAEADVVILTLGYVETWYDRMLGLYLNVAPPQQLVKNEPDRFEFRVLSYGDVLNALEELHALLTRYRKKPLKMLVTVSPVPLASTFRDMDVLVANTYSKSVQRAALDEFLIGKEGVDYFPSYEFVTLSNPTIAWSRGDYRHVSPDLVARIMSNVLTNYIEGGESVELARDSDGAGMTPQALLSSAKMMLKLEDFAALQELTAQNREMVDQEADVLLLEAMALRRLSRMDEAVAALEKAAKAAPNHPAPLERKIALFRQMKRREECRALLEVHRQRFPGRSGFRDRVGTV